MAKKDKEENKIADATLVKGLRGRLSFPALFKKDQFDRYSLALIIEPGSDADKKINAAMNAAGKQKWPGKDKDGNPKWKKVLSKLKKKGNVCYLEGDDDREELEGMMVLRANSAQKVPVKDRDGRTDLTIEDGVIYSGCHVSAVIQVWAQDNDWGQRINASLKGVQFWKDGEAFTGGGVASDDDFEDLSDGSDDDDDEDEDDEDDRPKKKAKSKKRRDDDDDDDLA